MKKLKEVFEKVKSYRYFQGIVIALASVMLVSLLTFVPTITSVNANSEEAINDTDVELISADEAKDIALAHANVTDVTFDDVQQDEEDDTQIYIVEFATDEKEYTYKINAITGDIIENESENMTTTISVERAKLVAMNHAGVSSVENYKVEADTDNDIDIYNVEFTSGNYKYEYTINASDASVIDSDKSVIDNISSNTTSSSSVASSSSSSSSTVSNVTESEAKSIAMKNAGVSSVTDYHIKSYTKDKTKVYKVVFKSGNYKYVYEIRQSDGQILDVEKHKTGSSSSSKTSGISESQAKTIAMNHAGVSSVSRYEIELDKKDDVRVYEIEFESGKYEYEYVIRVSDGTILRYEKDD